MKKQLLTLLAIACTTIAIAQTENVSKIVGDTLITSTGFKIIKGEDVKIGIGTMTDGDFKYIRVNSASLLAYSSSSGYNGLANQANSLPRRNSGSKMKVIKVQERGSKKRGFVNYLVLGGGVRYEVDVENAIASGELVIPAEYRPKNASAGSTLSTADELKKYKSLLDDGTITQEEFNAKKKQLLGL